MKKMIIALLCLTVTSCAQFQLVKQETVNVKGITVTPTGNWNKSPWDIGKKTEVWTADGHSLNEVIFISGISDGEALFKSRSKELPMPSFNASMLPNELQDLVLTSFKNLMGGKLEFTAQNMRPQDFSENMGFRFNISYFTEDGLEKAGDIFMTVKDGQLYAIVYMAAKMHYYPKHHLSVEQMFNSAVI